MCGLFGVIAPGGRTLATDDVRSLLSMGRLGQRRGSDASGLVLLDDRCNVSVTKGNLPFSQLVKTTEATSLTHARPDGHPVFLGGHSRLETHGFSAESHNNQPIAIGNWVVLHNGIITNEHELRAALGDQRLDAIESDTAVIAALLDAHDRTGADVPVDDVFTRLEGEYSVIAISTRRDVLCHTNVGNLYSATTAQGVIMVASEPRQLPRSMRADASRLRLDTTYELREGGGNTGVITSRAVAQASAFGGAQGLHLRDDQVDDDFARRVVEITEAAQERAAGLRRCTHCVLPETFPGIDFDHNGVCTLCRSFVPPTYPGAEALEADLRAASPDGHSVLVCLSGGRDSCYALHLIAEMGFDATAYTYDWGMVTTAARENMARLCGQLGVEHVLVSPNITKNRKRINRALIAWLREPRIETLPILIAGDKPYFRYAGVVSSERGDLPAVMADHPMETTGFKSALAGARPVESGEGGAEYRLGVGSLMRMGLSYGGHALKSPGLFPSLVAEGAVGFFDYYVRKHTFVRPFSYIPWEEDVVEGTLRDQYGWSSGAERSATSWRMGDGTAPFYNLMYLIALGMTEHDALRSNQARFGLRSRDSALELLSTDNTFKPLGLASYFTTVGLEPSWAMGLVERFAERHLATAT